MTSNLGASFDSIDPDLVETDAEKLLVEWYEWWAKSNEAPTKMDAALHVRTAIYFVEKQAARAVANAVSTE